MDRAIRITRMSRDVAARLDRSPRAGGRVHSVFARAINLQWSDGRLLVLHGPGALLSPFAAAVDDVGPLRSLRAGMSAAFEPPGLVAGGVAISSRDAEVVDCSVHALRCADERPPLGPLDWRGRHSPSLDSAPGVAGRAHLAAGIRDRDATRLIAGARALLGLGEGLTPSGDDCLVGALAVLHHLDPEWRRSGSPVLGPITRAARERTTLVGREFVLHALAGRFSEPVLAVLWAVSEHDRRSAVSRLVALGATSGADTLSGMRLACRALAA